VISEWVVPAVVAAVYDGDTVTLNADLGWHITFVVHVRVAHIDAPELHAPGGVEARHFLVDELAPVGSFVTLTSHSLDKYGRTLGTLTLADGRDVSVEMLAAGHAVPYEGGAR
jgi:endonuclease YncB( thermonuclease family)